MLSIEDVLRSFDPLLGVVPESEEVLRVWNIGARHAILRRRRAPMRGSAAQRRDRPDGRTQ
jgi:septum formation inhibitor-activating ATPase MinD